jgi:hypothetical protein
MKPPTLTFGPSWALLVIHRQRGALVWSAADLIKRATDAEISELVNHTGRFLTKNEVAGYLSVLQRRALTKRRYVPQHAHQLTTLGILTARQLQ